MQVRNFDIRAYLVDPERFTVQLHVRYMKWHPLSPSHLCLLSACGKFFVYNVTKSVLDPETCLLLESDFSFGPIDSFVGFDFCEYIESNPWTLFSVLVVQSSGEVSILCPIVPQGCEISKKAVLNLERFIDQSTHKEWIKHVKQNCKQASRSSHVEIFLKQQKSSHVLLQRCSIQPEPLIIGDEDVCDISVSGKDVRLGYTNGKVEVLVLLDNVFPCFRNETPLESSLYLKDTYCLSDGNVKFIKDGKYCSTDSSVFQLSSDPISLLHKPNKQVLVLEQSITETIFLFVNKDSSISHLAHNSLAFSKFKTAKFDSPLKSLKFKFNLPKIPSTYKCKKVFPEQVDKSFVDEITSAVDSTKDSFSQLHENAKDIKHRMQILEAEYKFQLDLIAKIKENKLSEKQLALEAKRRSVMEALNSLAEKTKMTKMKLSWRQHSSFFQLVQNLNKTLEGVKSRSDSIVSRLHSPSFKPQKQVVEKLEHKEKLYSRLQQQTKNIKLIQRKINSIEIN